MKCETLDVWKRSCRLSVSVYKHFADCRDFGFKDQITRSSLSVPSNLAEGLEKDSLKENVRYIEIARGSAADLLTQIYISIEIGYLDKALGSQWKDEINQISKMLNALKQTLKGRMGNK
jgi:four helix bundle protein